MFTLGRNTAKITGTGGTKSTCSSQVPLCGFNQEAGIQQMYTHRAYVFAFNKSLV